MKTLILGAIRCCLMFLVTASLFSVRPAQAYTVTLEQVGSNVVATGSGAINLTGLNFSAPSGQLGALINPIFGVIVTGTTIFANVDIYTGLSGPTSFGSGGLNLANIGSGDRVRIVGPFGGGFLFLPAGYVSGNALSDSSTYNGATFASLGVTPGIYIWTWGPGANQNFTLQIVGTVPDQGSTFLLLALGLLALVTYRKTRSMKPLIRPKRATPLFVIALIYFGLSPAITAVVPPPDGGYPGQGDSALFHLTTGTDNTAIGFEALFNDRTGTGNTATGSQALFSNTASVANTAIGSQALFSNTAGQGNTATGFQALYNNTIGGDNTAMGSRTLFLTHAAV